jgi:hypothetical protein
VASTPGASFAGLSLRGSLRPYQRLALDAFETDLAAGRRSTHLVAPPGSGKTVIGLEIVRRLDRPGLVLAPTATISAQWADKLGLFTDQPAAFLAPQGELHVLTYQSICQTSDPSGALRAAAEQRLVSERAAAMGAAAPDVQAEVAGFTGAARERFERDVSAEIARCKKAAVRGDATAFAAASLLSGPARTRLDGLVAAGIGTLVLDECHHLASLWGYLVRAVIAELPDVHVVGLTATSPSELTGEEAELYTSLLGPVDFQIPTPAVVRDGHLAPYQELAYFTTPLDSEREWLDERHARFSELLARLQEPAAAGEEDIAFSPWVIGRIRYRDTGDGAARVPFSTLIARRPELARAGLRYLASGGLELPDDAPRGEGWREPPTLDDWLVLISDYAVGCLHAHPGEAAERRLTDLQTGLRDLGFVLTRQGIRRGGSDVDRVLTSSAAKPIGAIEVLAAEAQSRGDRMRAAVLCDAEVGERQPEGSPLALTGGGTRPASTSSSISRPWPPTSRCGRCAAGRCGWILRILRSSRPTGMSSASRLTSPAESPTTAASFGATRICTRHARTARSRPASRTCTHCSRPISRPPTPSLNSSTVTASPGPRIDSAPVSGGGSASPTSARTSRSCSSAARAPSRPVNGDQRRWPPD